MWTLGEWNDDLATACLESWLAIFCFRGSWCYLVIA